MRSVFCAMFLLSLASGCGSRDRVPENPEDAGVALHALTADDVPGRWLGSVRVDTMWFEAVFEVNENGTAESEPPEDSDVLTPGLRQRYTWALSDDGTGPVVAFRNQETGRVVSGALRAEERAVIEGDSLSLVRG